MRKPREPGFRARDMTAGRWGWLVATTVLAAGLHATTLGALAGSLELRESYTGGHSRRVRGYSLLLADEMGIRDVAFRSSLAQGALLHDVGKIGIPDRILLKQGPLGVEERSAMLRHPELGASLVGEMAWLRAARELILAHHERYDGAGYPRGLAGPAIPLAARIFAVADAFDALTADRPYHDALSWQEAAEIVASGRATQFDPDVADAFLCVPFDEWSRVAASTGVTLRRSASNGESGRLVRAERRPTSGRRAKEEADATRSR